MENSAIQFVASLHVRPWPEQADAKHLFLVETSSPKCLIVIEAPDTSLYAHLIRINYLFASQAYKRLILYTGIQTSPVTVGGGLRTPKECGLSDLHLYQAGG